MFMDCNRAQLLELRQKIYKLERVINALKYDLQEKNKRLAKECAEHAKEKRNIPHQLSLLQRKMEQLIEDNEIPKQEVKHHTFKLQREKSELKRLESENENMFADSSTSKTDEIKSLEKKISILISENVDLRQKLQESSTSKPDEIKLLEKTISSLSLECEQKDELLHNYQTEIDDLKSKIVICHKNIEQLSKKEKQMETEVKQLEEKISQNSPEDLSDTKCCQNCWKYSNDISDLKTEINSLRDRLSEAAGNKLRDNNPNIADLSDMNRPTSLAEKFSSLYTDEYTDAMEVIEGIMEEQASALFMLQLLKSCYDLSKKLTEEQRHLLSVESFGFMKKYLEQPIDFQLSDSCLIYVKEFQKKISADGNNLRAVEMICLEDGLKHANLNSNQNIMKYMKKCSQLCWMMMISDPPIYLNFDVTVKEKLDKNVYNVFTKSGSQIEFLVWPAMYLYKAGPLLVKGVAQGK